jgi:hypothetical protein
MKNLIEISKIVTKKKVKKIEIFDDYSLKNKTSKFNEFYEALMSGKFRNDRDAATLLYGCSPTDDKYRQLKSRFRKRLLNTLFFLDVNLPDNSGYDRAYYTCNKDWSLVKILLANEAQHTAASLARQILTTSLKYNFADLIVNSARILRTYCSETDNEKEFEQYDQYIKQYYNVLEAEIRSEELYQRVMLNYFKPPQENGNLRERIDVYCQALVSLSEMYSSPVVFYNMFLVWTYRFEMLQDYEAMIEVCERAEKYMNDNPNYYQEDKQATFQLKKMSAFLHLKDYRRGKINAEKGLNLFDEGSDLWFSFMEYYLLLAMHTENYINALAILSRAVAHTRFKKLSNEDREKWKIYEIYLNYIVEIYGEENPILRRQNRRPFKIQKFLNDPVLYPKDMRIFTIFTLVAQVMFQIETRQYADAEDVIERLKNYANRQLKKDEFFRLIQFIRLLQQLVKASFKFDELSNTEKYLKRLEENPFSYRGLVIELEVITYEKLWEIILTRLKK